MPGWADVAQVRPRPEEIEAAVGSTSWTAGDAVAPKLASCKGSCKGGCIGSESLGKKDWVDGPRQESKGDEPSKH